MAQTVRGTSPLMQGKRQHIRKINRKARGIGETEQGEGSLLHKLWQRVAGWRQGCCAAASTPCSPGREEAQKERSDWALVPTTGLFGVGGILAPRWSSMRAIIPGSKALRTNDCMKLLVSKQAPTNLDQVLPQCSKGRTQACLVHSRIPAPSTVPDPTGTQH